MTATVKSCRITVADSASLKAEVEKALVSVYSVAVALGTEKVADLLGVEEPTLKNWLPSGGSSPFVGKRDRTCYPSNENISRVLRFHKLMAYKGNEPKAAKMHTKNPEQFSVKQFLKTVKSRAKSISTPSAEKLDTSIEGIAQVEMSKAEMPKAEKPVCTCQICNPVTGPHTLRAYQKTQSPVVDPALVEILK